MPYAILGVKRQEGAVGMTKRTNNGVENTLAVTMSHRELHAKLNTWLEMWRSDAAHRSDVASVLQRCLAETGDSKFFEQVPKEIQEDLVESLRLYQRTGIFTVCIAHTGLHKDLSEEAFSALKTLVAAGHLESSVLAIAEPKDFFTGFEHLSEIHESFKSIASTDPSLLSASMIEVRVPASFPAHAFPEKAVVRFQIERNRKVEQKDGFYFLEPVDSCVAYLALHQPRRCVFSELFGGSINAIDIVPMKIGRRSGLEVTFDFFVKKGSVFCEQLELERLVWLEGTSDGHPHRESV